jgi:hypothetical protein
VIVIALKKLCSYHNCKELVDYGIQYCDKHKVIADKEQKERYRIYKHNRLNDEYEKQLDIFYKSIEWIRLRELVQVKQYGIDILEYYKTGQIVMADTYHHINCVRDEWDKRLDDSNIIGLTQSNHLKVHSMYDKSDRDKKIMQDILIGLVNKFYKEFR